MKTIFKLTFILTFISIPIFAQTLEEKIKIIHTQIQTPFKSTYLQQKLESEISKLKNITKDEYETTAEFEKRKSNASFKITQLKKEYEQKIQTAETIYNEKLTKLNSEFNKLLSQTLTDITSNITFGQYDADDNSFPIKLNLTNQTSELKVAREYAKEFKQNASNLVANGQKQLNKYLVWEYFNWKINDPNTNNIIAIGEQRGIEQQVAKEITSGLKPNLTAEIIFNEPSGNKILDAEEKGSLTVIIKNFGEGNAIGVEGIITSENADGISSNPKLFIGEVSAKSEKKTNLELLATDKIKTGKSSYTFKFSEARGFAPNPIKITIDTKELQPPKFIIADIVISEADGDGKIESEEIFEVTARIQNIGSGDAKGLKIKFDKTENLFFTQDYKQTIELTQLLSGAFYDAKIKLYTNKNATNIPLYLTVTENSGRFSLNKELLDQTKLALNVKVDKLQEVNIAGIENAKGDIKIATGLTIDIEKDIPIAKVKNKNAVAVIFGIEKYKKVSGVTYAKRDAVWFNEYAKKVLGIEENNIYFLTDEDVSKGEFDKVFEDGGWLSRRAKSESEVYFYYAGHGSPDIKEKTAYLIPYDGDVNYPKQTGIKLSYVYSQLGSLKAKNVTVFLDACFSGANREKEILIAESRPIKIEVNPVLANNITVLSATSGSEIASGWKEKSHGLFSYFLMKGIKGDADKNNDKQISINELYNFIQLNVSQTAISIDREQTPQLQTIEGERILVK